MGTKGRLEGCDITGGGEGGVDADGVYICNGADPSIRNSKYEGGRGGGEGMCSEGVWLAMAIGISYAQTRLTPKCFLDPQLGV